MVTPVTSRQRILDALSHTESDRVPIDLGGTESSGIHADAYAALCAHLEIPDKPRIFDTYQQAAHVDNDL